MYGETSYQTAVISADMGDVYTREGDYKQAEPILSGALKVLIAYFPAGDPHIGLAEARWGHLLLTLKRYAEAEKQLASAYQVMEQQPTPQSAEIQNLRHDLAAVYAALNQPENARKFRADLTGVGESQPKTTGDH